jgi:hypothetical protein
MKNKKYLQQIKMEGVEQLPKPGLVNIYYSFSPLQLHISLMMIWIKV